MMTEWMRRLWYLLNRRRLEEELEREIQSHRAFLAESGGTPARFGSPLRLREQSRDVWGWNWLDTAWQDLRYAKRTLTPGYALTAGLILSSSAGAWRWRCTGRSMSLAGVSRRHGRKRTIVGVTADARLVKIQANEVAEMYAPLDPKQFENCLLIAQARLMRDDLDRRLGPQRMAAALMAGIGLLALALACIGIYGVVSLGAASRTKEIGIRMALGASRAGIVGLVMRQQTMPLVVGLLAGLAAASAAGMLMRGEPFYVDPIDVPVQVVVVIAFAVTAGAATLGPASRVARRDPLGAIRHE
jgi:FtsX-like permease family